MDFSLLSSEELDDFLNSDTSQYDLDLNTIFDPAFSKVYQAQRLFNQLKQFSDVILPISVVNLYLADLYVKSHNYNYLDKQYAQEQIINLDPIKVEQFALRLGFDPNETPHPRERILWILSILGYIARDEPSSTLFQRPIDEIFYQKLSPDFQDLNNYRRAWGLIFLSGRIPIQDSDKKINYVNGMNDDIIEWVDLIETHGSQTAFLYLIMEKDFDGVKYFLDYGLNPHFTKHYDEMESFDRPLRSRLSGLYPLFLAAQHSSLDIFKLLIEYGEDLYLENTLSKNVLHFASMGGNLSVAKYLISLGFDIKYPDLTEKNSIELAREWLKEPVRTNFIKSIIDIQGTQKH